MQPDQFVLLDMVSGKGSGNIALQFSCYILLAYVQDLRVETGSGHLGYPVNQVMFFPGQVGRTRFIKYPGLTRILHWITYVNNGVWSNQSNEIGVLDGDYGIESPFLYHFLKD